MKEYRLTGGSVTVYEGKNEINSFIENIVKDKATLNSYINQYCFKNNLCICNLCIVFKANNVDYYFPIFKWYWKNSLGAGPEEYVVYYGEHNFTKYGASGFNCPYDLINEFFEKHNEFMLPYQTSFLSRVEKYDKIFIALTDKNNDLLGLKISKKHFTFSGGTLLPTIDIVGTNGVGHYILHYDETSKKHFIYVDRNLVGREEYEIKPAFFEEEEGKVYVLNILNKRLSILRKSAKNLEKRINNLKNIAPENAKKSVILPTGI